MGLLWPDRVIFQSHKHAFLSFALFDAIRSVASSTGEGEKTEPR